MCSLWEVKSPELIPASDMLILSTERYYLLMLSYPMWFHTVVINKAGSPADTGSLCSKYVINVYRTEIL